MYVHTNLCIGIGFGIVLSDLLPFSIHQPPTAPTSHNFTKQRDKMRAKLEDKRKKKDSSAKGGE